MNISITECYLCNNKLIKDIDFYYCNECKVDDFKFVLFSDKYFWLSYKFDSVIITIHYIVGNNIISLFKTYNGETIFLNKFKIEEEFILNLFSKINSNDDIKKSISRFSNLLLLV